jgi:hypothetical protein
MFTAITAGGVTVTLLVAVKAPLRAVTVVLPWERVLRFPWLSMLATAVFEEFHKAVLLTSSDVPLCSCAMAKKVCDTPRGRLGLLGTTERDTGVIVPGVLLIVHPSIAKQIIASVEHANRR